MQSCLFSLSFTVLQLAEVTYFFSFQPTKDTASGAGMGRKKRKKKPLQPESSLTLQFLSSGVVSSNSSPSLKLISVFLKVL